MCIRDSINIMWLISYHIPRISFILMRCASIPSFALPIYKTTCDAKAYLYRSVQYRYLSTVCVKLASLINMVVDVVVQNPQKSNEYEYDKQNMYVVTPQCAAAASAAVVSAVVLRRPTKEYTHPYSAMHRKLPTAGIEVAPHYHQLLVYTYD